MPDKPSISIDINETNYAAWAALGHTVHDKLLLAIGTYATPVIALPALLLKITSVEAAIAEWGVQGNHGSHASLLDLRAKCRSLEDDLHNEALYVTSTAGAAAGQDYTLWANLILQSGYKLKGTGHPVGQIKVPQNVHFSSRHDLNVNQKELAWNLPLDVDPQNVKGTKVFQGTTANFAAASVVATPTDSKYIITNATGVIQTYYFWVCAIGTSGDGIISSAIHITIPADI